ncbi:MAG: 16S rRNA (cytidine(1402)-2'-O)-methyltransferase [Methylococcales bacterium]|nr:16S rRNA (cytidine(1402)-2'-O)-methyltransferase [Methylococcales bacterium]MBT7409580.1 16S rRNA (cytidine(1402)-2'-O)-methyltransferase [Methylococcales bacterium]
MSKINGILYVIATPIGNLQDISERAIYILKTVDLIACEDTRHSRKLLQQYSINCPLIPLHDHNESEMSQLIIKKLENGQQVALVSDAGTPLISDPGYTLINRVWESGGQVVPVPGACALISALSASGMATDKFIFEGFPPRKQQARQEYFKSLIDESRTLIFYESSHRIVDMLADLEVVIGKDRFCVIARELTKKFETIFRGEVEQCFQWLLESEYNRKGEFVVILSGCQLLDEEQGDVEIRQTLDVLLHELPLKQAVNIACKLLQIAKNRVYKIALEMKAKDD